MSYEITSKDFIEIEDRALVRSLERLVECHSISPHSFRRYISASNDRLVLYHEEASIISSGGIYNLSDTDKRKWKLVCEGTLEELQEVLEKCLKICVQIELRRDL